MRDQLLTKMDSTPTPKVEDVRDDAKDLVEEYGVSAGLKVRGQMTCHVTKENLQRGATTTTCTGLCRAERRPGTCGPMMTSILERDYVIAIF